MYIGYVYKYDNLFYDIYLYRVTYSFIEQKIKNDCATINHNKKSTNE